MDLSNFNMIWAVFLLPLAGALFQALGGRIITEALGPKLGRQVTGWLGVAPIALAFLIAVPMFISLTQMPPDQRAVVGEAAAPPLAKGNTLVSGLVSGST